MELKNNLISICSSINIFLKTSYTIKKNFFMSNKNTHKWELSKLQLDEIILSKYTDLSKNCVSYTYEINSPQQYIADMLRNVADAIMTSYPSIQEKNFSL